MERAVPILPADDLAVAKEFYVDALGFSVLFEATDGGNTGLLGLQRGTLYLTLDCPMSGHGREACVLAVGRTHVRRHRPVRQYDLGHRPNHVVVRGWT